jgi:hypothetical protein
MTSIVVAAQSVIGQEGSVGVSHDMDVSRSAGVMAREDGLELRNTITVCLLDSAKPGLVDVGLVGAVAITICDDTGVNTGGVAVPHLEVDIGNRVASLDVDDLVVEDDVESALLFDDVLSDVLTSNVYLVLVFVYTKHGVEDILQ